MQKKISNVEKWISCINKHLFLSMHRSSKFDNCRSVFFLYRFKFVVCRVFLFLSAYFLPRVQNISFLFRAVNWKSLLWRILRFYVHNILFCTFGFFLLDVLPLYALDTGVIIVKFVYYSSHLKLVFIQKKKEIFVRTFPCKNAERFMSFTFS